MNKRLRIGLLVMFLFLAIGFAAISTTLVINSSIRVGQAGDFDIYFSAASTNEGSTATISNNRQLITFSTKKLSQIGDTVVLDYTVTNDSYNYDANVTVDLVNEEPNDPDNPEAGTHSTLVHADYYSITFEGFEESETPVLLPGRTSRDGKITITLTKSYIGDDFTDTFTLNLVVDAVPRTSLADSYTISGVAKDDDDNVLANTALVAFSSPQVFMTDNEGHYEVTLLKGEHSVYYIPGVNEADLRALGTKAKSDLRAKKVDVEITHTKDDEDLIFNTDKSYREGEVVNAGDQTFIYLGEENNKIKLLARYNLNVKTDNNRPYSGRLGIQQRYVIGSELVGGYLPSEREDNYTEDDLDRDMGYGTTQWDSTNNSYASGTTIYGFVEAYKNILINDYHLNVASARVPTSADIEACYDTNLSVGQTYAYNDDFNDDCYETDFYDNNKDECDLNSNLDTCEYWYYTSYWVNDTHGTYQSGMSNDGYYDSVPITEFRKYGVRPIIYLNK